MNKIASIGWFLTLILLVIFAFIWWEQNEKSNEAGKMIPPDKKLCKRTDSGWACVLTNSTNASFTDKLKALDARFKGICEEKEGMYRCYGFCLPFYDRYCDFPFSDAGKECGSSFDCLGKCVVESDSAVPYYPEGKLLDNKAVACARECKGACSRYALRSCDRFIEVNDGTIEENHVVCD